MSRRTPRPAVLRPAALALVLAALPGAALAQPQVTATVTTRLGPLDRTEYTVTDGPGPLDRFKAVRTVRRAGPVRDQALLLLPPLGVNHGFYEQTDPHGGVGSSFAGFFALRGYDVWQYISRMEGVPPLALVRDVSCALAGTDPAHVADLGGFGGRVLGIGGGLGFGAYMPDNLALFTGAEEVEFLLEPEFGHIDHFMTPQHQHFLERPILRWLRGDD